MVAIIGITVVRENAKKVKKTAETIGFVVIIFYYRWHCNLGAGFLHPLASLRLCFQAVLCTRSFHDTVEQLVPNSPKLTAHLPSKKKKNQTTRSFTKVSHIIM